MFTDYIKAVDYITIITALSESVDSFSVIVTLIVDPAVLQTQFILMRLFKNLIIYTLQK